MSILSAGGRAAFGYRPSAFSWVTRVTRDRADGGRLKAAIALVIAMLVLAHPAAQQPSAVAALARESNVRAAIAAARSTEAQTIEDQIRFCEVPAPPFNEAARGELLRREFVRLGLQNVRVDRAGNVLGDRPGAAPRPRLVVAAHLDTVFPEGTDVRVKREGTVLKGPGIGDDCRGLAALVAVIRIMRSADIR